MHSLLTPGPNSVHIAWEWQRKHFAEGNANMYFLTVYIYVCKSITASEEDGHCLIGGRPEKTRINGLTKGID